MKQCPACRTQYTDDSLIYCLTDGANLVAVQGTDETQRFSVPNEPIRVNIPQNSSPTVLQQPQQTSYSQSQTPQKGGKGWLIGALVGLLLLGIVTIAGVAGLYLWKNGEKKKDEVVSLNNSSPFPTSSPAATPSPTPSLTPDEATNLKQKVADLEKQIQNQKNSKASVPVVPNAPNVSATPKPAAVTAHANSPSDGFLALRTEPSTVTGDRILKIPHGAALTVISCLPAQAGKKGRWCRVNYEGTLGWANDGWMTY